MKSIQYLAFLGCVFTFWILVAYFSFYCVTSLQATASDVIIQSALAPHKHIVSYATFTTILSVSILLISLKIQQKTTRLQLIRLYRQKAHLPPKN